MTNQLMQQLAYPECQECGVQHDPELPHHAQTIRYQMTIFRKYGRPPTYADSVAHCDRDTRETFSHYLKELYGHIPEDTAEMKSFLGVIST